MKKKFTPYYILCSLCLLAGIVTRAQNSVLINFGSTNCASPNTPAFSLISDPLGITPSVMASCGLSAQLNGVHDIFIAYNPKNNKIYLADIGNHVQTKIWILDVGLPVDFSCPASIPVTPTYSYSYISNNFEFDNNGDLWSLSAYNPTTGQCNIDRFDVATGTILSSKVVQFPAGNFPTIIGSGDLSILPNGRLFAALGNGVCRLYEITNYNTASGIANAAYLQTLPKECYGVAYLNGQLELAGNNALGTCYYYDYTISNNVLGTEKVFQNGQSPVDNTSISPFIGTTKQLTNAVKVNANTADITYEIYVKNMGNVILNNINVTDNLAAVFGANISNVTTSFAPGFNGAGLVLNPFYNGRSITNLLNAGQNLPNQTSVNTDYFFKVLVSFRVTNLNATTTYLNSAISSATVGNIQNANLLSVKDSSNNGPLTVIDPNNNGNATEVGENIPTPFNFGLIPVRFISVDASLTNKTSAVIKWAIATPTVNAVSFEVEYSMDGRSWKQAAQIHIINPLQADYRFLHMQIPAGNIIYYRIKQVDNDGSYVYSRIVLLHNQKGEPHYTVFPNPADNSIEISSPYHNTGISHIELYDASGRQILNRLMSGSTLQINTSDLLSGTYFIKIIHTAGLQTGKIMVKH